MISLCNRSFPSKARILPLTRMHTAITNARMLPFYQTRNCTFPYVTSSAQARKSLRPMNRTIIYMRLLKLDLYDKNNLLTYKLKIRILLETSVLYFNSSSFSHSDFGSSPAKTYMPTSEHCWKKNSDAQWARTSNLLIAGLTRFNLSFIERYVEWSLNSFCSVLYIATIVHLTASSIHNDFI